MLSESMYDINKVKLTVIFNRGEKKPVLKGHLTYFDKVTHNYPLTCICLSSTALICRDHVIVHCYPTWGWRIRQEGPFQGLSQPECTSLLLYWLNIWIVNQHSSALLTCHMQYTKEKRKGKKKWKIKHEDLFFLIFKCNRESMSFQTVGYNKI